LERELPLLRAIVVIAAKGEGISAAFCLFGLLLGFVVEGELGVSFLLRCTGVNVFHERVKGVIADAAHFNCLGQGLLAGLESGNRVFVH